MRIFGAVAFLIFLIVLFVFSDMIYGGRHDDLS